ncbi:membrane protein [Kitasatospora indigofera]|uniref:Membrane protein n=1 Tax=Kitasatospora indigofera TaxID=67307 RepID=A0A919FJA7_9ACTN|nr:SHOCT domain-containing protein [Kitasatospora indigofera]GHH66200.1 membrane protein [Kitasatospora indigofera]
MDDYPLLNIFWTMMWLFLWILWFFLLFRIFGDLFRDDSVGGWGKAGWAIFVILLPFLGVLVYLIARGKGMGEREMQMRADAERDFRSYVQKTAAEGGGGPARSHADELAKLAELKSSGAINEAEYEKAKAKVLA